MSNVKKRNDEFQDMNSEKRKKEKILKAENLKKRKNKTTKKLFCFLQFHFPLYFSIAPNPQNLIFFFKKNNQ